MGFAYYLYESHLFTAKKNIPETHVPLSNGSLDFPFCQAQPQERKGEEHLQLFKIVSDI